MTEALTGDKTLDELHKCGITHIIWLPDTGCRFLHEAMMSQRQIVLVPVCREGEAIPIAAGLTLGGKKPAVLHQNTGLFESGDSLRGLGLGFPLPLLLLIGYRGWRRQAPLTDSAAIFTEPVINAWGIRHYFVETDADLGNISAADREAQQTSRPVAVIFRREYT